LNMNRAPSLGLINNVTGNENQTINIVANGTDPDNEVLYYSISDPRFSASNNTFSWTPSFTDAGIYNMNITVTDLFVNATRGFTVTVVNVNRPPLLSPIANLTYNETQTIVIALSASDPDFDNLTYSINDTRFSETTPGVFSWNTGLNDSGEYSVTVMVTDGNATATRTVYITVVDYFCVSILDLANSISSWQMGSISITDIVNVIKSWKAHSCPT
jgi:hypothetical protein